jgi:BirA family biotin operon repressor/biotin-[acetyl-CoA-carboxylase] ligase
MSHDFVGHASQLLSQADLDQVQAETFVECVEFHEQIPSTNDRALQLARARASTCPLLVVTNRQTGGRGRGSNRWWASQGSLTFSLLLEADQVQLPPRRWPQVSLHTGLAIAEAIENLIGSCGARLKWPNDVYLENRKVSGVLVEVPAAAPRRLVLGVGLNVNNTLEDAPPELTGLAIALWEVTGQTLSLSSVLTRVLVQISETLSGIGSRDEELCQRWRARCMLTGRKLRVDLGARGIEGVCHGIDHEGALIVKTTDGVERCFGGVVTHC